MTEFDFLLSNELLSWAALQTGFAKGLVKKSDIVKFSVLELQEADGGDNDSICALTGCEKFTDAEVGTLLSEISRGKSGSDELLDLWRFASLALLKVDKNNSADEVIERLQELYAFYDYPDDMRSCSIYANDGVSPISALASVVDTLSERFR